MIPEPPTLSAPDTRLQDLKQPLARTRWLARHPERTPGAYGASLESVRELLHYSGHDCGRQDQQAQLNVFTQFRVDLQRIPLHFLSAAMTLILGL